MKRIVIEIAVLTILLVLFFNLLSSWGVNFRWVATLAIFTIPASIAGELYGRRAGKAISSGFAWQVALTSGAALSSLYMLYSAFHLAHLFNLLGGFLMTVGYGVFLLSFLSIRLVFRWGVSFGVQKTSDLSIRQSSIR